MVRIKTHLLPEHIENIRKEAFPLICIANTQFFKIIQHFNFDQKFFWADSFPYIYISANDHSKIWIRIGIRQTADIRRFMLRFLEFIQTYKFWNHFIPPLCHKNGRWKSHKPSASFFSVVLSCPEFPVLFLYGLLISRFSLKVLHWKGAVWQNEKSVPP